MSKTVLAFLAVLLLTALPAILQGRFANRWGEPANLSIAARRLHQLPRKIGPWKSEGDQRPLSKAVCQELGLASHFHRQYVHSLSGERLDVLLMVGPPGRLVRHPPDVCYANRANRQIGEVIPLEVSSQAEQHQFKLLHFQRMSQPVQNDFWVAYAYATEQGLWTAPTSPRMAFGGEPVLYKLQVLSELPDPGDHQEVCQFLRQLAEAFSVVFVERPTSTSIATSGQLVNVTKMNQPLEPKPE